MKVQLPHSLLSVYSAAKDASIAEKLPVEKRISFLAPFHDNSCDVNGGRKRVRQRCGLARKLEPTKRIIAATGATSGALGAYEKTTFPLYVSVTCHSV